MEHIRILLDIDAHIIVAFFVQFKNSGKVKYEVKVTTVVRLST